MKKITKPQKTIIFCASLLAVIIAIGSYTILEQKKIDRMEKANYEKEFGVGSYEKRGDGLPTRVTTTTKFEVDRIVENVFDTSSPIYETKVVFDEENYADIVYYAEGIDRVEVRAVVNCCFSGNDPTTEYVRVVLIGAFLTNLKAEVDIDTFAITNNDEDDSLLVLYIDNELDSRFSIPAKYMKTLSAIGTGDIDTTTYNSDYQKIVNQTAFKNNSNKETSSSDVSSLNGFESKKKNEDELQEKVDYLTENGEMVTIEDGELLESLKSINKNVELQQFQHKDTGEIFFITVKYILKDEFSPEIVVPEFYDFVEAVWKTSKIGELPCDSIHFNMIKAGETFEVATLNYSKTEGEYLNSKPTVFEERYKELMLSEYENRPAFKDKNLIDNLL